MAEEEEKEEGPTDDETAELEALLDDVPVGDEGEGGGKFSPKTILAKLTSSKKMMMLVGGGVLLLLLLVGGAAYYFLAGEEVQEVAEEEVVIEEEEV
ncbi:MAG: hypothetical protein IID18_10720, partial [Nitrospinae bacterium]|nr:hypothetical protein [Nitrospinota bacterium]